VTCPSKALILGVAAWVGYAGTTWIRYGRPKHPTSQETDALLDKFMPLYEVVERHSAHVNAPTDITFAAAIEFDIQQSGAIRAIFKIRGLILGSGPEKSLRSSPLLSWAMELGWGLLAEVPGREVVLGAVTKPWKANVVFRSLPPGEFAAFHEPGYVKIAWTLRADPVAANESIVRSETRVICTDTAARAKFRRYWAFLSPGIVAIRRIAITMVKHEAERRAIATSGGSSSRCCWCIS
jgi:hypothetical protein